MARYSRSSNSAIKIARILNDDSRKDGLRDEDYVKIKRHLKSSNIKVRFEQYDNDTLLHMAIRRRDERLIDIFLLNGGDLATKNDFGESPLELAVRLKCDKILQMHGQSSVDYADVISMDEDMNEDYYIELRSKITQRDDFKFIKAAKIVDYKHVFSSAINYCDIFPNLFALQIEIFQIDEENCLKLIAQHFNDGRPMFVNFLSSLKFLTREGSSNEFTEETNSRIIGSKEVRIAEINEIIAKNDTFSMCYLKLFKIPNEIIIVENAIKYGNLPIFLAAINAPFRTDKIQNFLPEISKFMSKIYDNDNSILKSAIQHDKNEIVDFIIKLFKNSLKHLPFEHKKLIINLVNDKNLNDIVIALLRIDFPFPNSVKLNVDIEKLLEDRQKLRTDDLDKIKEFIDEFESIKFGYDKYNQSALMYAIANKHLKVYSYLLSEGFRSEDGDERIKIQKIIDALPYDDKKKLTVENSFNARKDKNNHLRLLANKIAISTYYQDNNEFKANFNKIINYLTELNEISEIKPILRFCAELDMLKITFDYENCYIDNVDPLSKECFGSTYDQGLIFVAALDERHAKSTLIHELCHYALYQYYENGYNPYFECDDKRRKEFDEILKETREFLNKNNSDQCDRIISSVLKYDEEDYHCELIVRPFEILASFDHEKILELRRIYKNLFNFAYQHVSDALKIDDFKERMKVRHANKYFDLTQELREANQVLKLSKIPKNKRKIEKMIDSDENYLIVSNIPILALINIKKYLYTTRKSLYDSEVAFISPKSLENDQIYEDFKSAVSNCENIIVDFSKNHNLRVFQDNLKLIIVADTQNHTEIEEFLSKIDIIYNKEHLDYTWNDLKSTSQDKLRQTEVKFQNKLHKLEKIIDDSFFDEEILYNLCYDNEIKINTTQLNAEGFYMERSFLKIAENVFENGANILLKSNQQTGFRLVKDEATGNAKLEVVETLIEHYNMQQMFDKTINEKIILISDIGGSGKSYVLREIAKKFKSSSESWILYVDLRTFLTEFKKWRDENSFLKFFHTHFGQNLKVFERNIFESYYKAGKVKILLDGFDEISISCKKIVLKLIQSVDLSENVDIYTRNFNQLWITTRKHLEIDLQAELKVKEIFSLLPLNSNEQTKFLINYWNAKKVTSSESLEENAVALRNKVHNFTINRGNLIGIMQQLQILAEISIKDNKIDIASIKDFTMYDIYLSSVEKYDEKFEEGKETKRSQPELANFYEVHQYHALLWCFQKDLIETIFANFGDIWNLELIARADIITYENEKVLFIHATYIEFFIANFFILQLKRKDSWSHFDILMKMFCDILAFEQLVTVQMFINDKLKEMDFTDRKIKIFAKNSKEFLTSNHFILPLRNKYENINLLLLRIIQKFDDEKIKSILMGESLLHHYMFSNSAQNYEIFETILNITNAHLSDDEFITVIERKGTINRINILHSFFLFEVSLAMMTKIMETIVERAKNDNEIIVKLLLTRCNEHMLPIFKLILQIENFHKFEYFWNVYEQFLTHKEMIENIFFNGIRVGAFAYACISKCSRPLEFIYKRFVTKFKQVNFIDMLLKGELNAINSLSANNELPVHKVMWNCLSNELSRDESNRGKIKQLLFAQDMATHNLLLNLVTINPSRKILQLALENYGKFIDTPTEISRLLNNAGQNLLQQSVWNIKSADYYQDLWNFIKQLFQNDQDNLKKVLKHTDKAGNNVFYNALGASNREICEKILTFAEDAGMKCGEIKGFILPKEFKGSHKVRNILHFVAGCNRSIEINEYAWEIVKIYFKNSGDIFELITLQEQRDMNLLQIAVAFNSLEIAIFTWEKIKTFITIEKRQKNFIKKLYQGKTLFELSFNNRANINIRNWTAQLYAAYNIELPKIDMNEINAESQVKISENDGTHLTFEIPIQVVISAGPP